MQALDDDPLLGRRLGELELLERIAEGGHALVYRAEQANPGREAVVKVLRTRYDARGESTRRFLREVKVAAAIDHPYAAHIYAFGAEPDGLLWCAMELVRGQPLDRLIATQGPMAPERFAPLFERIAEVVDHAHERGIVHCDLKPANVMIISRAGRLLPKLLDFGIAHVHRDVEEVTSASSDRDPMAAGFGGTLPVDTDEASVGTPAYMAPELWMGAVPDRAVDLYALAVLAYESVTGAPPFRATDPGLLARAHLEAPVPRLGDDRAALDEVFARGLAKSAGDRFATAIELASAFAQAAGVPRVVEVPELDLATRQLALRAYPRPVAEAVAALVAASDHGRARDAVVQLAAVLARWIGLVAMAARSRLPEKASAMPSLELARLRDGALSDEGWLALARAMVRPFAERAELFPIRELVSLLVDDIGPLTTFCESAHELSVRSSDAQLAAAVAAAGVALASLQPFLEGYQLVVSRGEHAELFTGVRLPCPLTIQAPRSVPIGDVTLLDGDGAPVVGLAPLIQIAAPAPGHADEIFLFEGEVRGRARLIARPGGYQRHDDRVWEWLRDRIGELHGSGVREDEATPYRGLEPFTDADQTIFVGREREVDICVNRLRAGSFLAIVGASGAGKSSFVHAGLAPALGRQTVTIRPGATPCRVLAGALARNPEVLVVDQLEELFTICGDPAERAEFAAKIFAAPRVIVTLRDDFLMRAEALPAFREQLGHALQPLATPDVADLVRVLVEPATRCGYRFDDPELPHEMALAVASRPGGLALLSFTAARLWELRDRHFRLLRRDAYEAIGGVTGALALHAEAVVGAMTATQRTLVRTIFRHVVTDEGTRAPTPRAELLALLGDPAGEAVLERLIAARLLTCRDAEDGDVSVELVHEALVGSWPRLAEWRRDDAEGARTRARLRAAARDWEARQRPRAGLWRDEDLAELERWRRHHPEPLTADEERFAQASFGERARGRRRRTIALVASALVLIGFAVVALTIARTARRHEAQSRDRLAELYTVSGQRSLVEHDPQRAIAYLAEARRIGSTRPALAFLTAQAERALAAVEGTFDQRVEVSWAAISPDGATAVLARADGKVHVIALASGALVTALQHGDRVIIAEFSRDGRRLITCSWDRTVAIWDVATWNAVSRFTLDAPVIGAELSPRAEVAIATTEAGTLERFDLATGARTTLIRDSAHVSAAIGSDLRIVAVSRGEIHVFDRRGDLVWTGKVHDGGWTATPSIGTGGRVALGGSDGTVATVDLDARRVRILGRHAGAVISIHMDNVREALVTGGEDGTGRIWDLRGVRPPITLVGHAGHVGWARFVGAEHVATAATDGSVLVWSFTTGARVARRAGHTGAIRMFAIDPLAPQRILTASGDGTARLFDTSRLDSLATVQLDSWPSALALDDRGGMLVLTARGQLARWDLSTAAVESPTAIDAELAAFAGRVVAVAKHEQVDALDARGRHPLGRHPEGVTALGASIDGTKLASTGKDGALRLWDLRSGALLATARYSTGIPTAVAFSPDGRRVATGGTDDRVRIWDAGTGEALLELRGAADRITRVTWSADGTRLAAASWDRTARIFDTRSGKELAVLTGHAGGVDDVELTPDGALVITGGWDRTARVWDASSGALLTTFEGHTAKVVEIAVSADGRRLVTGSLDRSIRVWDISRDDRTAAAIAAFARCASPFRIVEGELIELRPDPTECLLPGR